MTAPRLPFSPVRLILTASVCFALSADTITLRNGTSVEGNYLGGTAREIRVEVGDRIQTFAIDTVSGVQFAGGSGAKPQAESSNQVPPRPDLQSSSSSSYPPTAVPNNNNAASTNIGDLPQAPSGFDLPSGTQLTVRMIDAVDSSSSRVGDTFRASLDEPIMVNGQTVISRGAEVSARLVEDQQSGKIQGRAVLKLVLTSLSVNGRSIEISTQELTRESGSRGARSAKVIGGTTALGAIVGGLAGGGRGAAIGAGSGAAVGTGAQEVTSGQRVRIPSETRLVFTLTGSVRV